MIFLDTAQSVSDTLRPYWSDATKGRATVVQAVPDMLEIVPLGTCKGNGVKVLLDHLGVTANEVPQISIYLTHLFCCLFLSNSESESKIGIIQSGTVFELA